MRLGYVNAAAGVWGEDLPAVARPCPHLPAAAAAAPFAPDTINLCVNGGKVLAEAAAARLWAPDALGGTVTNTLAEILSGRIRAPSHLCVCVCFNGRLCVRESRTESRGASAGPDRAECEVMAKAYFQAVRAAGSVRPCPAPPCQAPCTPILFFAPSYVRARQIARVGRLCAGSVCLSGRTTPSWPPQPIGRSSRKS